MTADSFTALRQAAEARPPLAALVLGSGLNEATDGLPCLHSTPFGDVPSMPKATVAGHRGRLSLHEISGRTILVFQGRLHFYEGHPCAVVERPIRLAAELGARVVLLTNAAGGIGAKQSAGSLMAIRHHIAANSPYWWRQPGPGGIGPDEPSPYSPRLLNLLGNAATAANLELPAGVYACVTGPNYETPAEVSALQAIGVDAVGMSTVHEAKTAAALGLEVAAISCIANLAAGLSPTPLSHTEVLAMVQQASRRTSRLLHEFLRLLAL